MHSIRQKIESVIKSGGKSRPFSFATLLHALSFVYGGGVKIREHLYKKGVLQSKKLPCKVISIGNITAGGTGKTPMAVYVAETMKRSGCKTAIVSRGYGGAAETGGGVVGDGRDVFMGPEMAGDEPFMMASRRNGIPVVVGADRFGAGMIAATRFNPDVIVLDDAFQHLRLERDLDIVLLDGTSPFGNGRLLPRGPLREPVSALSRGDAFVLTKCGADSSAVGKRLEKFISGKPVFMSVHVPYVGKAFRAGREIEPGSGFIEGRSVFAFSGIANNDDFFRTVETFKCEVPGSMGFPDHHPYSEDDLSVILRKAKEAGADCVATTEKDFVRIFKHSWPVDLAVLGFAHSFSDGGKAFETLLTERENARKNFKAK